MTMLHSRACALGTTLLITAISSSGAWADSKPVTMTETETFTPTNQVTPHEAQVMSSNAAAVVRHVSDARADIKKKEFNSAKDELNQAQALVDALRSEMPGLRIKDRIAIASQHIQSQDTEILKADLVPIYSEITYAEDLAPAKKLKGHLDKANQALKSGDKSTAKNELKMADESVAYSETELPLNETQKNVKAALMELNKNQPKLADQDLAKVENNIQFSFSELIGTPVHQKAGTAPGASDLNSTNKGNSK
jgi:hypothetical protein